MKKPILKSIMILLSSIMFFLSSCASEDGYKITIKIKNAPDTIYYLLNYYGKLDKYQLADTAEIQRDGSIIFKGDKPLPGGVYFLVGAERRIKYFDFILTEPEFKLITDTADLVKHMKVINSAENVVYHKHQLFMDVQFKKMMGIKKKKEAYLEKGDSVSSMKLDKKLSDLENETHEYRLQIRKEHPELFFSKVLKAMDDVAFRAPLEEETDSAYFYLQYNFYQNHFFDNIDFSDDRMMRTPFFENRLDKFIDKMTVKHPDSIKYAAERIVELSRANDEIFRYVLSKFFYKYANSKIMGMDAVFVHLAEKYYLSRQAFWVDSALLAKIYDRVVKIKPNIIGNKSKNLIMRDVNDNYVSMHEIKSEYTIVVFFDYDCGHCKKVMPKLRDLYKKYNPDTLQVMCVYIGTEIEQWKKYIKDNDMMDWINTSDPSNYSNFRLHYDISSTPVIYLMDKDKVIIAKRIAVDQLQDFLNRFLKRKEVKKNK